MIYFYVIERESNPEIILFLAFFVSLHRHLKDMKLEEDFMELQLSRKLFKYHESRLNNFVRISCFFTFSIQTMNIC